MRYRFSTYSLFTFHYSLFTKKALRSLLLSVMPEIAYRRFADEGYDGGSLKLHFFAKNEADGIARGGKPKGGEFGAEIVG